MQPEANANSGGRQWQVFRRRWWLAGVAFLAGAVLMVLLLLIARPAAAPDEWLALLGSVMGGIFAAAGLVVGLIAVLTTLSLDDRIRRAYVGAQAELLADFEEKANTQIEAHIGFLQATNARDWQSAERLTKEALDRYPGLHGAKAYLGSRLADNVLVTLKLARAQWDHRVWHPDGGWMWRVPSVNWPESAPLAEAIGWLEDAISESQDTGGELLANLALMWGAHGRPEKMLEYLRKVPNDQRQFLRRPDCLLAVANGCKSSPAILKDVGVLLDITLPASADTISNWIEAIDLSRTPGFLTVWATAQPGFWAADAPVWPAQVAFGVSRAGEGRTADLSWYPAGSTTPKSLDHRDVAATVSDACQRFAVVARCEGTTVEAVVDPRPPAEF